MRTLILPILAVIACNKAADEKPTSPVEVVRVDLDHIIIQHAINPVAVEVRSRDSTWSSMGCWRGSSAPLMAPSA